MECSSLYIIAIEVKNLLITLLCKSVGSNTETAALTLLFKNENFTIEYLLFKSFNSSKGQVLLVFSYIQS